MLILQKQNTQQNTKKQNKNNLSPVEKTANLILVRDMDSTFLEYWPEDIPGR